MSERPTPTTEHSDDPWQATSPAVAVMRALYRHNIAISQQAAEIAAEAALGYADTSHSITELVDRRAWETPEWREDIRHRMRHKLLNGIIAEGCLLVSQPVETLTYHRWSAALIVPPDGTGSTSPDWDWDQVAIKIRVPVRSAALPMPPVPGRAG